MKKYTLLFILFLLVFSFNNHILAVEIEEYPEEIELITDLQQVSIDSVEEQVSYILLKDVSPDDILQIKFQSVKRDDFKYINQNVKVEFRIKSSLDWSEWGNLSQPLEIHFNELDDIQDIRLAIRFSVPQSIKIRKGFYSGELSLKFI